MSTIGDENRIETETPIADFIDRYIESDMTRLHVPGHKGKDENLSYLHDITEVKGADELFDASGIIKKSREICAGIFETADTFYSAEGSSHCIRSMLYMAIKGKVTAGKKPVILAARNVHNSFLFGAALLDIDVHWIFPKSDFNLCSQIVTEEDLLEALEKEDENPVALYITCPDYLGGMSDIKALSKVCHERNMLLLVDNAHGAYLKFLGKSLHPMDLGADLCSDSAHKTLPALTGGAYLHVSKNAPSYLKNEGLKAMALFGSTSPSYLILRSLDLCNKYMNDDYRNHLLHLCKNLYLLKEALKEDGWIFYGNEPTKVTVFSSKCGYRGEKLSDMLREKKIECEFSDRDFSVFMFTTENTDEDLQKFYDALHEIKVKDSIYEKPPVYQIPEKCTSLRDAMFSESESVSVTEAEGRILASVSLSCPPAIPVLVMGERVSKEMIEIFQYYHVDSLEVIREV